jgi:hypothetical protein
MSPLSYRQHLIFELGDPISGGNRTHAFSKYRYKYLICWLATRPLRPLYRNGRIACILPDTPNSKLLRHNYPPASNRLTKVPNKLIKLQINQSTEFGNVSYLISSLSWRRYSSCVIKLINEQIDSQIKHHYLSIFSDPNSRKADYTKKKFFKNKNSFHTCNMTSKKMMFWLVETWVLHVCRYAWVECMEGMTRKFNKTWHKLMWHHVIAFNLIFFFLALSIEYKCSWWISLLSCGCIQHKRR